MGHGLLIFNRIKELKDRGLRIGITFSQFEKKFPEGIKGHKVIVKLINKQTLIYINNIIYIIFSNLLGLF